MSGALVNSCGDIRSPDNTSAAVPNMEEQTIAYDWSVGDTTNAHYYSSHQTPEYHTYDYVGPLGDPRQKVPMSPVDHQHTALEETGKIKHEFMLDTPQQMFNSQNAIATAGETTVFPANLTCSGGLKMKTPSSMHAVDMDANELLKIERKRARNRAAATKCRLRKLERISVLDKEAAELRRANDALALANQRLRGQLCKLRQDLRWHLNNGCSLPAVWSNDESCSAEEDSLPPPPPPEPVPNGGLDTESLHNIANASPDSTTAAITAAAAASAAAPTPSSNLIAQQSGSGGGLEGRISSPS